MRKSVSQSYLLGISEGRAQLKWFLANGFTLKEYLADEIENCNECLAKPLSAELRDMYQGSLDFALNQASAEI